MQEKRQPIKCETCTSGLTLSCSVLGREYTLTGIVQSSWSCWSAATVQCMCNPPPPRQGRKTSSLCECEQAEPWRGGDGQKKEVWSDCTDSMIIGTAMTPTKTQKVATVRKTPIRRRFFPRSVPGLGTGESTHPCNYVVGRKTSIFGIPITCWCSVKSEKWRGIALCNTTASLPAKNPKQCHHVM